MNNTLLDFASRIRQSSDLETSWSFLQTELDRLGFIHAKYGFLTASPEDFRQEDVLLAGQFCEEWERFQAHYNWVEHDYIASHLLTQETAITFSYMYELLDNGHMTKMQAKNHAVGREIGMANGVALPLRERNPIALGGISLEADRGFTDSGFVRHLDNVLPQLKNVVEVFHSNINRQQLLDDSQIPSKRERECLVWLIKGFRVQQIAHQMGTHPKTVEKQLANVRLKLSARTNIQAAIRALLLNLITP